MYQAKHDLTMGGTDALNKAALILDTEEFDCLRQACDVLVAARGQGPEDGVTRADVEAAYRQIFGRDLA